MLIYFLIRRHSSTTLLLTLTVYLNVAKPLTRKKKIGGKKIVIFKIPDQFLLSSFHILPPIKRLDFSSFFPFKLRKKFKTVSLSKKHLKSLFVLSLLRKWFSWILLTCFHFILKHQHVYVEKAVNLFLCQINESLFDFPIQTSLLSPLLHSTSSGHSSI
jgi:hypothetical protein